MHCVQRRRREEGPEEVAVTNSPSNGETTSNQIILEIIILEYFLVPIPQQALCCILEMRVIEKEWHIFDRGDIHYQIDNVPLLPPKVLLDYL